MTLRVAVLVPAFVPGFKGGGPIRSVDGLTSHSVDDLDFFVLTRDRDLGDAARYPGVEPARWTANGTRKVCYVDTANPFGYLRGLRELRRLRPHVYYVNGLWNPRFGLVPLALLTCGLLPRRPVVLAPRGELAPAALAFSAGRKRLVGALLRAFVLPRLRVTWHATAPEEAADIRAWAGSAAPVHTVANLVVDPGGAPPDRTPPRDPTLRVLFLSRLVPKKNLAGALAAAAGMSGPAVVRIVGTAEDAQYLQRCRDIVARMPAHIRVEWAGPANPTQVAAHFRWADVFFLPTLNENFGHVFAEALGVGCPVLTSTATPWTAALTAAGMPPRDSSDVPGFTADLDRLAAMDASGRQALRVAAREAFDAWSLGQREDRLRAYSMLRETAATTA